MAGGSLDSGEKLVILDGGGGVEASEVLLLNKEREMKGTRERERGGGSRNQWEKTKEWDIQRYSAMNFQTFPSENAAPTWLAASAGG